MHRVRPYRLFTLLESAPSERLARVKIPHRKDLKLLETFLLMTCVQLVKARRVFEFGTFLGSTTYNLALNTPDDAEIFTLDLDPATAAALDQHPADASLTQMHLESVPDFGGTPERRKIETLTGDSTHFDFSPWRGSIDLVFIDGGHDKRTVCADTKNAFDMVTSGSGCILWHDYGNPEYPDVTRFLDSLAVPVLHVEDTMLCVSFQDQRHIDQLL